jgi:parallel beta-helix repeat protein
MSRSTNRLVIMTTLLTPLSFAGVAAGKVIVVSPGSSIQAAVDTAVPGDTVVVKAGTYHEAGRPCPSDAGKTCAVVVNKDRIGLIGLSRSVVLENAGDQDRGIEVARTGASGATCLSNPAERITGSLVQGLTVKGFEDDGIFLFCVDNWLVDSCRANDNLEYGIFPSHCGAGRVAANVATGANDTGIYIGQSHDVRVDHNVATDNVSGFEIENCTGVELDHNLAYGNTGGILTFTLPFLDVKANTDNRIHDNLSLHNNRPNTCLDPSDAVCGVPQGTGILVLATDNNRVEQNVVTGNNSFGIAVANFCLATNTPPDICDLLDINPDPDGNVIARNVVIGNGSSPAPSLDPVFAVDLAWDLTGSGNCWKMNKNGTEFPSPLPACP